jgi:hypothetical protein
MRAAILAVVCACSPEIANGVYLCGAEQDCPDGLACNGADNTCVIPTSVVPFACDPLAEVDEPDQDAAHAHAFGVQDCESVPIIVHGCLAAGDADDWYTISSRPECSKAEITATLTSPYAFEPLTIQVTDATGATKLGEGAADCQDHKPPDEVGEFAFCIAQTVTPGTTYGVRVTPTGEADCGGQCNFNRYELTIAIDQP